MDKRKEEIVEVALKRFAHYGFSKTTMNEIADDLKITKANLYYYYSDKYALVHDVILCVTGEIKKKEEEIIDRYDHNLLDTLFAVLDLHATYIRKHYALHINENLEWIKGMEISDLMSCCHNDDVRTLTGLFQKAQDAGEIFLEDIQSASETYLDVIKGISIAYSFKDIITGIPNEENVDIILDRQKKATRLIFEKR